MKNRSIKDRSIKDRSIKDRSIKDRPVISWPVAEGYPMLRENEVQVWRANLDLSEPQVRKYEATLSDDELARADRFRFSHLRRRFVVARGVLRSILSECLRVRPEVLRFGYNNYGKPYLIAQHITQNITQYKVPEFNVAHSEEVALYALAYGRAVGIDIEYERSMPDALEIAERFFSPHDKAVLRRLPASEIDVAFFDCWTRKEAYVKARGMGLSLPLDRFSVLNHDTDYVVEATNNLEASPCWKLRSFRPCPGYLGAVAARGTNWQPTFYVATLA